MQTPYDVSRACVAVLCAALLTSCGKDAPPPPKPRAAPPGVLITATQVQPRRFEVLEEVVGSLENVMDPKLGAEVAGKVIRVLGFAGKSEERASCWPRSTPRISRSRRAPTAPRSRASPRCSSRPIASSSARRSWSRRDSCRRTWSTMRPRSATRSAINSPRRARSEQARRNIGKAKVVAPLDGEIERQAVAEGDYVKVGDLLFTLVGTRVLRAQLPPAWQGAPRGLRGCAPR